MASLRRAAVSFASLDASPGAVLRRLSDLMARTQHDYFATVLCALIDIAAHEVRLASAGHLPPLLIDERQADFVEVPIGVPIGAAVGASYTETMVSVGAHATLISFTDGLVERRGESIDGGLGRLRAAAFEGHALSLDDLVNKIAVDLAAGRGRDDTAILAVRWQT